MQTTALTTGQLANAFALVGAFEVKAANISASGINFCREPPL
jgi:hypothetical protein